MMTTPSRTVIGSIMVALAVLPSGARAGGMSEVAAQDGWHLRCDAALGSDPGRCTIGYHGVDQGDVGGEFGLVVTPSSDGGDPRLQIWVATPMLPKDGVSLAVNRRQIGRVVRQVCDVEGCTFDAFMDGRLLSDLRGSDALEIEYKNSADRDVRANVGTKGLWSLLDQVQTARHR